MIFIEGAAASGIDSLLITSHGIHRDDFMIDDFIPQLSDGGNSDPLLSIQSRNEGNLALHKTKQLINKV
jgi:hypothetical protein